MNTITLQCCNCAHAYKIRKSLYLKQGSKYCSRKCYDSKNNRGFTLCECFKCKKIITVNYSRMNNSKTKRFYCDQKCMAQSFSKKITEPCPTCKKPFSFSPSRHMKKRFCSRECYKNQPKKEETLFSNIAKNGYFETSQKRLTHRVIVEKFIGRKLSTKENVHHINEVRTDNRIENLYLFKNRAEHMQYHQHVRFKNKDPITESNLVQIRDSECR